MYGDAVIPPNSRSHDYEKTRILPRIPDKSRTEPYWTGPPIPISDDDKEAAAVAKKRGRDAVNHKKDAEDLEKRHEADAEHTKKALEESAVLEKQLKKEEEEKKHWKDLQHGVPEKEEAKKE